MATELVPHLASRAAKGAVGCDSCHLANGRGTAKILGNPRSQAHAIEWMTAFLSENFTLVNGEPLHCKLCHAENLGSPGFRRRIILTDALASLPRAVPGPRSADNTAEAAPHSAILSRAPRENADPPAHSRF
jgi:hypothetical protein